MSPSSDIEKLFDHFGGDPNAYQEIGRENEARTARTRWPLLVTLDLTQPTIPPIGPRGASTPRTLANAAPQQAADTPDGTPKDASSVTRAKSRLFTQPHRRDIPPVVVPPPLPVAPSSSASRFGSLEVDKHVSAEAAPSTPSAAARADAAPRAIAQPTPAVAAATPAPAAPAPMQAQVAPVMPVAPIAPIAQAASTPPGSPATTHYRSAVVPAPAPASVPSWPQTPAPARAYTAAPTQATQPAQPAQPAQQPLPASILGRLFAQQPTPASPQPAAPVGDAAPLQSVFDRLRGTPSQATAAPASAPRAAAAPAPSNSWLVNGPRRS